MTSIFDGVSVSKTPKNRDELVVRGDLAAEVAEQLDPQIRRLEMLVRSLIPKEYPTPQITAQVHAPVSVTADIPPAEVEVEVPGMDALHSEVAGLRADVKALAAILSRPVVRTVERGDDQLITRVTETRKGA